MNVGLYGIMDDRINDPLWEDHTVFSIERRKGGLGMQIELVYCAA